MVILIGNKQRLTISFVRNLPVHSRHSMQHNLIAMFFSIFCGSHAFRHIWTWEAGNVRAATSCSSPKAHKIPSFIYTHAPPACLQGVKRCVLTRALTQSWIRRVDAGPTQPKGTDREPLQSPAEPPSLPTHWPLRPANTKTMVAWQHQRHTAHNVFLCQIDKI